MIKNPITVCPVNFNNLNVTQNDVLQGVTFVNSNKQVQTGVIETYQGSTDITPDNTIQTLSTNGKYMTSDITVQASGGGVTLNISYGNSAPSDTSKLWIKTSEGENINISNVIENQVPQTFLQIDSLPFTLNYHTCQKAGNKIYIFGGLKNSVATNEIYIYDLSTNTLTQSNATISVATSQLSSAIVGNKIYIFGGNTSTGQVRNIYDIETDTITTFSANITGDTFDGGAVAVGKYIYYFGGSIGGSYPSYRQYIRKYDTETDTVNTISGVSLTGTIGRIQMGISVIDTKIYLFGGQYQYSGSNYSKLIVIYDTTTDTLTISSTELPAQASRCNSVLIGTDCYLFTQYTTAIYKYDSVNNTIQTLTNIVLPSTNMLYDYPTQDTLNAYFIGGYNLSTIYKFSLQVDLTENNLLLLYNSIGTFPILNTADTQLRLNPIDCYKGNSSNIGQQVKIALYDTDTSTWVEIN